YQAFIQDSDHRPPKHWDGDQYPDGKGDHPVIYVSWDDAQAYCQWLSQKTGKTYRLPTEAQWEKAARGPLTPGPSPGGRGESEQGEDGVRVDRIYPWGDDWDSGKCNFGENNIANTTPVGQYSPEGDSPYGCTDMAGNVWEWCADWFAEDAYKNREDGLKDPQGAQQGGSRLLRGGSWSSNRRVVRCAARGRYSPDFFYFSIGFRVVSPG
ncbi:MAG: formylglycine-generating enzyme family protein, partial [Chloroflexota bacterium]|nr:formylglycine-generating enzyme family protein [Chloroflexota bacterium]